MSVTPRESNRPSAVAGVSYAYLSDIETGRGRPGSGPLLAIAEALMLSPSELMRQAEAYQAQITGEPTPDRTASVPDPSADIEAMIQGYSDTAPSPTARRWFHAGRALAGAQLGEAPADDEPLSDVHEELRNAIAALSPEDAVVVLALVRRLSGEASQA